MLTYTLDREAGPLYEALYRGIRGDILEGRLTPGEKAALQTGAGGPSEN